MSTKSKKLTPTQIRYLLHALNWNSRQLAEQIGVTLTAVAKWCQDPESSTHSKPGKLSEIYIRRLAEEHGVDLDGDLPEVVRRSGRPLKTNPRRLSETIPDPVVIKAKKPIAQSK